MAQKKGEQGFSILELIVVMVVIAVMSAVSIFYLRTSKKLLAVDEQASRLSDILQEARQKVLTQKAVMRVEIDNTTKSFRLIGEGFDEASTTDDRVLRNSSFGGENTIRIDKPSNVTGGLNEVPTDNSPVSKCVFTASNHPLSVGNSVCTIRFLRNGLVADAGTGGIGTNAVTRGFTVYVWKPTNDFATTTTGDVIKAITISGSSASIRLWDYRLSATTTDKWFDVSRIS